MNVRIVSTDEVLWAGKASSVVVPSIDGDLGILPGRQPILAVLRAGKARVTAEDVAAIARGRSAGMAGNMAKRLALAALLAG